MTLVWKLLRQHISVAQFAGFAFANLIGILIILLSYQFYCDVLPVFTSRDSFMRSDYLIVSKKLGVAGTLTGRANTFSDIETNELAAQPFVKQVGRFTSTQYKVEANMGISGQSVLNSEIFFESVPDAFVDVPLKEWSYKQGNTVVPIILPRTYINMYNFGFAQAHSLPKISEGLAGMIDFNIFIHGNGYQDEYHGKVIGFSGRLNTILVPQSFMEWSNARYAPDNASTSARLIVEVSNPTDDGIVKYLDKKGYEVDADKLQSEKTAWFLRLAVIVVMVIGVVICVLSFYILMLSIYLLVQKNTSKLENLLLIGYSTFRTALPYAVLTICLNAFVLITALVTVLFVRGCYMEVVETLFPDIPTNTIFPSVLLGLTLFFVVSLFNIAAIRRKIMRIWWRKDV